MEKREFEHLYREQVREILEHLQSTVLLSHQLETAIVEIGESIQRLTQNVEHFLASPTDPEDSSSVF